MNLVTARAELRESLAGARAADATVGLVPTMGALHEGHLSLVAAARAECDYVAVTIFVNPTQFGDPADLASYPRDLTADVERCRHAGVAVVFAPPLDEMYPDGLPQTSVVPGYVASVLEGASRPGHFAAVATVVTKLLCIAGPCRAYFGEKDYQQLIVVRRLVSDLDIDAEIVGCPIVREADGLAMSSRNRRLDGAGRAAATALWRALSAGRALVEAGARDSASVECAMVAILEDEPLADCDYAVVADPVSLRPVREIDSEVRLLVAARIEPVRLIDNVAASEVDAASAGVAASASGVAASARIVP